MTPEQLLGLPKPIAELTDAELEAHLARFFPATRPRKPVSFTEGRAGKATDSLATSLASAPADSLQSKLAASLKAAGLDSSGNLVSTAPKRNFLRK